MILENQSWPDENQAGVVTIVSSSVRRVAGQSWGDVCSEPVLGVFTAEDGSESIGVVRTNKHIAFTIFAMSNGRNPNQDLMRQIAAADTRLSRSTGLSSLSHASALKYSPVLASECPRWYLIATDQCLGLSLDAYNHVEWDEPLLDPNDPNCRSNDKWVVCKSLAPIFSGVEEGQNVTTTIFFAGTGREVKCLLYMASAKRVRMHITPIEKNPRHAAVLAERFKHLSHAVTVKCEDVLELSCDSNFRTSHYCVSTPPYTSNGPLAELMPKLMQVGSVAHMAIVHARMAGVMLQTSDLQLGVLQFIDLPQRANCGKESFSERPVATATLMRTRYRTK